MRTFFSLVFRSCLEFRVFPCFINDSLQFVSRSFHFLLFRIVQWDVNWTYDTMCTYDSRLTDKDVAYTILTFLEYRQWKYCIFIVKNSFSDTSKGNGDTIVSSTFFVDDCVSGITNTFEQFNQFRFLNI